VSAAGRHRLDLHLVTDEHLPVDRLLDVVGAAVDGGVTVVQLRAKRATVREQVRQLAGLARVVRGRAALLADDRVDAVLAAREDGVPVDGVHLGQADLSPVLARRLLGAASLVGWTAHAPQHLEALRAMPPGTVDYLGVGVVRATASKDDHPPQLGVDGVAAFAAAAAEAAGVPSVAIGGVRAEDVGPLRAAGLAGVAVVSAICSADDPAAAARALRAGAPALAGGAA